MAPSTEKSPAGWTTLDASSDETSASRLLGMMLAARKSNFTQTKRSGLARALLLTCVTVPRRPAGLFLVPDDDTDVELLIISRPSPPPPSTLPASPGLRRGLGGGAVFRNIEDLSDQVDTTPAAGRRGTKRDDEPSGGSI